MLVAAKTRLTKIEISEGRKKKLFLVPKETAEAVTTILRDFLEKRKNEEKEYIDAFDLFPHLKDPVLRAATSLKGIRLRQGLTQKKMAEKIGVSQGDLSKMEKGERPIGKKIAMRIGKRLGIDYRRFL